MDTLQLTPDDGITDEMLADFARELVISPTNKNYVAARIAGGDFVQMSALLERADNPEFKALVHRLNKETPDSHKLQSKEAFIVEVRDKMSGMHGKMWLDTAKFVAEMCGFIGSGNIGGASLTVNVMQVPATPHTQNEKNVWEDRASSYAAQLVQEGKDLSNGDT